MGYQSSSDPHFLQTVKQWMAQAGEVLVMIRFSHAGGSKSYEFFSSFERFQERISQCEPKTCFIVFREPQLPYRGVVDDQFIAAVLNAIPDGKEHLIAGLEKVHHGQASWLPNWDGMRHQEMKENLEYARNTKVAVGLFPPWLEDNDNVTSAVVPMADGSVVCGVY